MPQLEAHSLDSLRLGPKAPRVGAALFGTGVGTIVIMTVVFRAGSSWLWVPAHFCCLLGMMLVLNRTLRWERVLGSGIACGGVAALYGLLFSCFPPNDGVHYALTSNPGDAVIMAALLGVPGAFFGTFAAGIAELVIVFGRPLFRDTK